MEIVDILTKRNNKKYNLIKLLEEINELGVAVSQHLTRDKSIENIAEEIADVELRCKVVTKHLKLERLVEASKNRKKEELFFKNIKGELGKEL